MRPHSITSKEIGTLTTLDTGNTRRRNTHTFPVQVIRAGCWTLVISPSSDLRSTSSCPTVSHIPVFNYPALQAACRASKSNGCHATTSANASDKCAANHWRIPTTINSRAMSLIHVDFWPGTIPISGVHSGRFYNTIITHTLLHYESQSPTKSHHP